MKQNSSWWFNRKRRSVLPVGAHPNTALMQRCHNRVTLAFLAVWNRLKSCWRALPKHTLIFDEPDWLRILKLLAQVYILSFKARRLIREQRLLIDQNRLLLLKQDNLLVEQRNLRLQQVNNILGQPSSAGDAKNLFRGVESTQDAQIKN